MNEYTNLQATFEEYPDFEKFMQQQNSEIWDYVDYALSFDNIWVEPDINGHNWHLHSEDYDDDGVHVVFSIFVEHCIKDWMFFDAKSDNVHLSEINRNSECAGIPIWATQQLIDAVSVCDVCGKPTPISDLHPHHYAGACCKECYPSQKADWDNKPNGWWTH